MSTHYDRLPTLEERVRASSLVVTGRVHSIKPLPKTRIGEIEKEQAIAHVTIAKALRGAPSTREIDVQFVSRGGTPTAPSPVRAASASAWCCCLCRT